jgi:F420-0:gamma-glutamyl ligase
MMQVQAIKTRPLVPPQDNLYEVMDESLPPVTEKSVVVVTSKVVAIHQGRCIPIREGGVERDALAFREAEWYAPREIVPGAHILFTIKHNTLIASAGIDMSNGKGHMVLWPKEPMKMAKEIYTYLKKRYGLKELGVLITDSHVVMMRTGVVGVSIGHFGFNPVKPYMGEPDIFGRILQYERTNIADALAATAVLEMGEGVEQTPLAIITGIRDITFTEDETLNAGTPPFKIPREIDLFEPMLSAVPWKKGQGGLTEEELEDYQKR